GLQNSDPEVVGNLIPALAGHEGPQVGLEVEDLQAGHAIVQVLLDLPALGLGELAVEEVVEGVHRLLAVNLRIGRLRHLAVLPDLAPYRIRTTPSGAPFFR